MDVVLKKHIKRMPLYVFALGVVIVLFYVGSIAAAESPGRTLAVLMMLPFYIGCVVLASLLVWIITKLIK